MLLETAALDNSGLSLVCVDGFLSVVLVVALGGTDLAAVARGTIWAYLDEGHGFTLVVAVGGVVLVAVGVALVTGFASLLAISVVVVGVERGPSTEHGASRGAVIVVECAAGMDSACAPRGT